MSAEQKLKELGLQLPSAPKPGGVYQPVLIQGNMAYVSGHGPLLKEGSYRQTGLAILASLKASLGSLDRVNRLVKSFGMVNAAPNFSEHPQVINGYSELMCEVFGPVNGVGARSAVGMGSLPGNITVEIEAVFDILTD
jgi:enamine deaminase RidA (YjgF/YER057c/UK114 family)